MKSKFVMVAVSLILVSCSNISPEVEREIVDEVEKIGIEVVEDVIKDVTTPAK